MTTFLLDLQLKPYYVCRRLLWVGRELGIKYVIIEGESLTLIKKVQNKKQDKSVIGPYIVDIKDQNATFYECKFQHARRAANKSAHSLASEGLKRGENVYLIHEYVNQDIIESEVDRGWR
ncbi:hypothetical protein J1N35_025081 [Gossypium stocksii]|uniref:RNase H type-1 domain-containing protein n=1 Tax=Gossypium stocksii TaxID=47602 RepID=A0A9D3ZXY4_9ROSI|nr:hypothetical protein J1N35_025081 [Gossypium stocksii]